MPEPEFDPTAIALLVADIGESTAREVLTIFFRDAAEKMDLLAALADFDQMEAITRHAHSLKSAAAAFGFTGISSLARRLEVEAPGLGTGDIKAQIAALRTAIAGARSRRLLQQGADA